MPLNSTTIDPKCLDHQTKKLLSSFTFALSFLFFSFFFFQAKHLITMAINMIFICSTTWNSATYLMITKANRLTPRGSLIHQNQTRAFKAANQLLGLRNYINKSPSPLEPWILSVPTSKIIWFIFICCD